MAIALERWGFCTVPHRPILASSIRLLAFANPRKPQEHAILYEIELVGNLTAMLRLATGQGPGNAKNPSVVADGLDVFLGTESGDAGTRNRRCQYISVVV